ncbi:MAG: D-2-hydroxyacid dehydrogenase [Vicinamibacterales bacterium]
MIVLLSIPQRVTAWQLPPEQVVRLRAACPQHEFLDARTPEARAEGLTRAEVACTWRLSPDEIATAPHLRWVHSTAVAAFTLSLSDLAARDIVVTNTRGVQDAPIAEHVFATLLAIGHRLPLAFERQRTATWAQNEFVGDRLPVKMRGRRLGIVGLGAIGQEVARLGVAFGMKVTGLRRRPELGGPPGVTVWGPDRLDEMLASIDAVVLAAPLTPDTETLLDARRLALLPRGAALVNIARGALLDETALVAALTSGALGGASLDVFSAEPLPPESPLWRAPNLILTPHTSGFRAGHWDDVIDVFIDNLGRWERGDALRWQVDPVRGY